ncbi:MAG: Kae1-associated kinase Bud32 [Methanopyri archaeon]|nr:Kae1-associated kinase Bud32 [Methanopyri archaeon]
MHPGLKEVIARGRVLARGAESIVVLHEWFGLDAVYKIRLPREYRHPDLDSRLRRNRTRREARTLVRLADAGLPVPTLYEADVEECLVVTEYVPGPSLRDALEEGEAGPEHVEELGRIAASLHGMGIVHNDLTTSNVIVADDGPVLIDLGMSFDSGDPKDHAIDLRVFERCLESSHPSLSDELWRAFLRGYEEEAGEKRTETVLRELERIKSQVRYV